MVTRTLKTSSEDITHIHPAINGIICPKCKSLKHSKVGKDNGIQRYKCKICGKHHRDTTRTVLFKLRKKSLVKKYIQCMQSGMSLRKSAKATGISLATAFAWRHRFLNRFEIKESTFDKSLHISSFPLPYSTKGIRTKTRKQKPAESLLIFDQSGNISIRNLGSEQKSFKTKIITSSFISESSVFSYTKSKTLAHTFFNTAKAIQEPEETSSSQKMHNIKNWLDTFRGVATKYLQNYWNWYMIINKADNRNIPTEAFFRMLLAN